MKYIPSSSHTLHKFLQIRWLRPLNQQKKKCNVCTFQLWHSPPSLTSFIPLARLQWETSEWVEQGEGRGAALGHAAGLSKIKENTDKQLCLWILIYLSSYFPNWLGNFRWVILHRRFQGRKLLSLKTNKKTDLDHTELNWYLAQYTQMNLRGVVVWSKRNRKIQMWSTWKQVMYTRRSYNWLNAIKRFVNWNTHAGPIFSHLLLIQTDIWFYFIYFFIFVVVAVVPPTTTHNLVKMYGLLCYYCPESLTNFLWSTGSTLFVFKCANSII